MTTIDSPAAPPHGAAAHGHGHGEHSPHLAHHFDTPEQQFDSGKLGMWLFLATEVLLFGGLFCAYTVYRAMHPEIFHWGHQFLDVKLGGTNTIVLICSSLTMAWAVRCAQLGQQRNLIIGLVLTLLCAGGFMGIKYVEYSHKIHMGLMWGTNFNPHLEHGAHEGGAVAHTPTTAEHEAAAGAETHAMETTTPPADGSANKLPTSDPVTHAAKGETTVAAAAPATLVNEPATSATAKPGQPLHAETPAAGGSGAVPAKTAATEVRTTLADAGAAPAGLAPPGAHAHEVPRPKNAQIFFGIYFAMTGLHGFHVLAGMICITWLLIRSKRGDFGPDYFTPVDLVGLYWHIVDLIWIFLFPLLYLID
jgi:cytochrome c oxidase subunit 3